MNYPFIAWYPDGSAADITFLFDAYMVAELKRVVLELLKGSAANFAPEAGEGWIPPADQALYLGESGHDRWTA